MRTTFVNMAITLNEPYIQPLNVEWYQPSVQQLDMLRLDVLHPVVSGNKWYKLKYNVKVAIEHGYRSILTFGGGYSNHLVATAAAAQQYGIRSVGIVRGQYEDLTPTLTACKEYGMELAFVPQSQYKLKSDEIWLNELLEKYNTPYVIPEGGANNYGRKGAEEIAHYISSHYTHVCVSAGTGTTLVGLRNALPAILTILGYVPMKMGGHIQSDIAPFITSRQKVNWHLFDKYHFGGFGKWTDTLIDFMNEFYKINEIPLDIVYTSKMMFGLQQQLQSGYFSIKDKVLCVHTGGLQGNSSVGSKLIY